MAKKGAGRLHAAKRRFRRKAFARELRLQCASHGEKPGVALLGKLCGSAELHSPYLLKLWAMGERIPKRQSSFGLLNKLESHFGLPKDHFRDVLYPPTSSDIIIRSFSVPQRHIVRAHLPKNFDSRSPTQQERIVAWIRQNVLVGSTDYGASLLGLSSQRFVLQCPSVFENLTEWQPELIKAEGRKRSRIVVPSGDLSRFELPEHLIAEFRGLVEFKCSLIAPHKRLRTTRWGIETAYKLVRSYCRMFGALVASPSSAVKGLGASRNALTLAILVFPSFWEWYLGWHQSRRGVFTANEHSTLVCAISLFRESTGWIRQSPQLANNLRPIEGIITAKDIRLVTRSWEESCNKVVQYLSARRKELLYVMKRRRDPFAPIIAVLKSQKPLLEYRKVADEILRQLPDCKHSSVAAAESVRAYLLIRFGMQLGLRRRNLSELLVCPFECPPKSEALLSKLRRGELRWLKSERAWEIYIPAVAFKNSNSRFFREGPFRVVLSDVGGLYHWIRKYLVHYRLILLDGRSDPETFFVRTRAPQGVSSEFIGNGISALWRAIIVRFGIYNPFTQRGAIEGLLPHGPHSIRDVIATHLVKETSSYELAAFALHSSPQMIEKHYCRFLAEEKVAIAGKLLDKVWETDIEKGRC